MKTPTRHLLSWILQILAAGILLQTLYFKFTGHPDSVAIFTELGMEPNGRILVGVIELVIGVLLLIPGTAAWGALLGAGNMAGALMAHFTKLGFEGSHGILGGLAAVVLLACVTIVYLRRREIGFINNMFANERDAVAAQKKRDATRDQW